MKVRLESDLQLIITPESYVEQVALKAWVEKNNVGSQNILIEAFNKNAKKNYCTCHLPEVHGHLQKDCPYYKA